MNGRCFFKGNIVLFTMLLTAAFSTAAFTQVQPQKPVQNTPTNTTQPKAPVVEELVFKKKIAEPSGGLITGLAGGYFSPLGTEGTMLESSWIAKIFVYNNAIGGKALGVGFEAGYADLKDKDNRGGIKYIPVMGYATLTWNIFGVIDMQPKFGAGLMTMLAEVDNGVRIKKDSTVDFTLSAGFAILKTFYKHYFAGAEYVYYYIFERDPSKAHGINFFAGYKF